ncbi:MAG: hypothetical protein QNJ32_11465 [Xenococcaceae cyanobacterium MO_167.B27]|nr:hypothetical protein [Xenococcaceae cyanobacterium MO_167.B27]
MYAIAAIFYSVFSYRFNAIFFLCGLITAIPSFVWNLYYFDNLTGGYSNVLSGSGYIFTLNHFITASLGILISPSRGLLVFYPIVFYSLFGAYQVFKHRFCRDEKLIGCMTIASILLLLNYCFFRIWWAGHVYGPRFMTDIMPILCYLLGYCIAGNIIRLLRVKNLINIKVLLFITCLIFSTSTQIAGAFGFNPGMLWNSVPLNVDIYHHRLWTIRDSQLERYFRALFNQIIKPNFNNPDYINGLDGVIKQITDENDRVMNSVISVQPGSTQLFKASLENKGVSRWFGYKAALPIGEIKVRGYLFDRENNQIRIITLYIAENLKQNESTTAIGSIIFPQKPGKYKLVFELISEGISNFPNRDNNLPYVLNINVVNKT